MQRAGLAMTGTRDFSDTTWCYFLVILCGGFSLPSISNRHGGWSLVASDFTCYKFRKQNFKLWLEKNSGKFLIVLVCDRCPSWGESLWPRSYQAGSPRSIACKEQILKKRSGLCLERKKLPCNQNRTHSTCTAYQILMM